MRRRVALPARTRVALVAHGIHDNGGMERAFAELIRRIHDRYDVVVISSDLGDELRGLVEWRRVPVPRRPAALRFAVFYVLAAARLLTTRAQIVHTLGAIVPNEAQLASVHFCAAGYVDTVGRLAPPNAPLMRRLNTGVARALAILAERRSYRPGRLDVLVPVSDGVARELERSYPGIAIRVGPNGVDRSRFRPDPQARDEVRRSLAVAGDSVVVLFVGGDWHGKGLALAIEAVGAASRRSATDLRLVVVGHGDEQHFTRVAEAAGAGRQVIFVGPRRDTERFYAAADIFVLPSWYETFSLAAFEAAASGLPIVAACVHGVSELVGDDVAGFSVARDANEIAAALLRLAASPDLRQRLGCAARERSSAFTWERSAAAMESVYRDFVRVPEGASA